MCFSVPGPCRGATSCSAYVLCFAFAFACVLWQSAWVLKFMYAFRGVDGDTRMGTSLMTYNPLRQADLRYLLQYGGPKPVQCLCRHVCS